jgi:hypothetical protein
MDPVAAAPHRARSRPGGCGPERRTGRAKPTAAGAGRSRGTTCDRRPRGHGGHRGGDPGRPALDRCSFVADNGVRPARDRARPSSGLRRIGPRAA